MKEKNEAKRKERKKRQT